MSALLENEEWTLKLSGLQNLSQNKSMWRHIFILTVFLSEVSYRETCQTCLKNGIYNTIQDL